MVGLRPHPLSRSIAAWAPFRRSADADRAGNDPARARAQLVEIPKIGHAPALMDPTRIAIIAEFLRP